MGGHDVLDLRTVFRLLDGKGADQNALAGNAAGSPFKLRKPTARRGQLLQDGWRLKTGSGQFLQREKGAHGPSCIEIRLFLSTS